MIQIHDSEIEFVKVFAMGFGIGWYLRKHLFSSAKLKWIMIKNLKYVHMNEENKD